jgi:PAS domain S-box-containing protein
MSAVSLVVPLAASLLYLGLAAVTLVAGRRSLINRTFAVYVAAMLAWSFSSFAARVGLLGVSPLLWSRVLVAASSGLPIFFYHFVRVFLGLKRHHWVLYGGYALYLGSALLTLFSARAVMGARVEGGKFYLAQGPAMWVIAGWSSLYMILAVWHLVQRYAESREPSYRSRIRYPLIGVAFVVMGTLSNEVPALSVYPLDIAANAINALILAYTIQRYQLINITPVLRQALTYALLMIVVGGGYLLSFLVLEQLTTRYGSAVLGLAFLLGVVVSMAFAPLRQRWQMLINRFLFRRRYAVQRMLQRLSSTATSIIELEDLTQLILDEVTTTMDLESASILLRDAATGEFYVAASKGVAERVGGIRWRPDHPVLRSLARKQLVTRAELGVNPEFQALWGRERVEIDQLHSEAFIPLHVQADVIGVFAVGPRADQAPYTADDLISLTTLANQTAVAVENARLYAMEQRRLNESLILLDIATAVGSTLDLRRVLRLIAQRTAEATGVHRCSIFLLDEQQRTFMPVMSQFASGAMDAQLWEAFQSDVYLMALERMPALNAVVRDRQPLILSDEDVDQLPKEWVEPFRVQHLAVIPLISRDRVIGAMVLDHIEPGRGFEQEQINLAMTIGSHAAAAFENARLYEQTMEEKARTDVVLQETFSGIAVVDDRLRIISMNPGAEQISGYVARDVRGKLLSDVFGPQLTAADGAVTRAVESGEKVSPQETKLAARQGEKDVLLGVTPLRGPSQGPGQYLLSFADISKLKEVDRLKSNIVANVSHELRTPLTSIIGFAELLRERPDGQPDLRTTRYLENILISGRILLEIINDLLDFAKIEAGKAELRLESVYVDEICSTLVDFMRPQADDHKLELALEVDTDLPIMITDRGKVRQILFNLLSNAVKFTPDGGAVMLRAARDGSDMVRLSVTDTGPGIVKEDLPIVFEKFRQADQSATRAHEGTGLGLAISKELTRLLGGDIGVESRLGEGSTFWVRLPVVTPEPSEPPPIRLV